MEHSLRGILSLWESKWIMTEHKLVLKASVPTSSTKQSYGHFCYQQSVCACMLSCFSRVRLRATYILQPSRLLHRWDSLGKILEWVVMPSFRGYQQIGNMKASFRAQHPIEGQQMFWALTQFATLTVMVTWCDITKLPWKEHHLWTPSLKTSRDSARTAETCSSSQSLWPRWVQLIWRWQMALFLETPWGESRCCSWFLWFLGCVRSQYIKNPCPAPESEWLEKFLHWRPHLYQWRTLYSESLLFTAWQRPN